MTGAQKAWAKQKPADLARIAELEATTRHDVKAVEYYVREQLTALGLTGIGQP